MELIEVERLRSLFSTYKKKRITGNDLKPSAVLIPIFIKDGEYHLFFTKRSHKVLRHKGQISFPGGEFEPADKELLATALRETYEETGLCDLDILGELDDFYTTTKYIISPFLAFLKYPFTTNLNNDEIDYVITPTIADLIANEGREYYTSGNIRFHGYYYMVGDEKIWGITGLLVKNFLDIWRKIIL